jgi:uncharacterized protein involved in exopolysaccharide biosynthesis
MHQLMNENRINILDILLVLVKYKYFIILFTGLCSIFAVIYALTVTELWTSDTTIMALQEKSNISLSASALLSSSGLSGLGTVMITNERYASMLKSRTVSENMVNRLDLIKKFEIKEKDPIKAMSIACNRLQSSILQIKINDKNHFLTIKITTKDKELSKMLAEQYLDTLINYVNNKANNTGRQKKELFENRIEQITDDLKNLTDEITLYKKTNNIIDLENQAKASVDGYYGIIKELTNLDLEIAYAEKFMQNSMMHNDLLEKKQVLIEKIRKLEKKSDDTPFFLALNKINDSYYTMQEKVFGVGIYRKILETIYPQLELARIEEIDNMDKVEIIDRPNIPGKRSYPNRAFICVFTFTISFMFSCAVIILFYLISSDDINKLKQICKTLFRL